MVVLTAKKEVQGSRASRSFYLAKIWVLEYFLVKCSCHTEWWLTASPCRKRLAQRHPASALHPNFISDTSRKVAMTCRRLENMVTYLESMTPRWPYGLCHFIAVPSHSSLRQPFKYRKNQCRWLLAPFARAHESRIDPKGCKKPKSVLSMCFWWDEIRYCSYVSNTTYTDNKSDQLRSNNRRGIRPSQECLIIWSPPNGPWDLVK